MSHMARRAMVALAALTLIGIVGYFTFTNLGLLPSYAAHSHTQVSQATTGDWTMFQGDLGRSGYNAAETTITAATAAKLKLHWSLKAGGSISTQVIEANSMLYWGSWDGLEHATNLSGQNVWTANLGQTIDSSCAPPTVGVASTATVSSITLNGISTPVVFVGGGNSQLYALNATTGAIIWQTPLGTQPSHFLWSSPLVYNGNIYEGVSSFGDCPLVTGEMVMLNATTGTIEHTFATMPGTCKGAGVWDSPTIDTAAGTLYFGTSNAGSCSKPGQYFWSLIEVNLADLSLVHFWQLPLADRHTNSDFGLAAPMLFTATINGSVHNMLGLPNQNGKYYVLDRADISQGPLWEIQLATPGRGSISSSAWDGTAVYAAGTDTTINGVLCQASVRALNPATGAIIWQTCWTAGRALNAVIAVPGLVVVGQGSYLNVLDATSGQVLFRYKDTNKAAIFYGAPVISNGILYAGNEDGTLFAFGL